MTFFNGEILISSTKVFFFIFKVFKTTFAISSGFIALLLSSPGVKLNFSKKFVRTIPGFIIQTRILLDETSCLIDCEKPLRPNLALQYKLPFLAPDKLASDPINMISQ